MKRQVECIHCQHTEDECVNFCNKAKKEVKSYKCSKGSCKHCEFKPLVLLPIGRCDECPLVEVRRTMGAGDAYDYFCGKTKDKIVKKEEERQRKARETGKLWYPICTIG